ncbi:S8 family serine peptidase [Kineococcus esterisolvens]|uniref:S8 family serine peptidase n=1 Tax=unclassified Kineococcus TaxID=2621656 RepID=UPI003D7E08E9
MRKIVLSSAVSVTLVAATLAATQTASSADPTSTAAPAAAAGGAAVRTAGEYVVVYDEGTTDAAARAAIAAAGGTVVSSNESVGYAFVRTESEQFAAAAAAAPGLLGAAANRRIGTSPDGADEADDAVERLTATVADAADGAVLQSSRGKGPKGPGAEPLADLQWDMAAIDATAEGSHAVQPGSDKVSVGIIDTGVDGSHPDLAPNFDAETSRNFVTDLPEIDGPCEVETCVDPADVDEGGHGTHVAGTVAAAVNGLGIAGVAPEVNLVNLRAGQDSGYFFLQPTLDAITYAADSGVDVVNMSFYVDPWLFNCQANPADSPEEQAEQRVTVAAVQRAIDYARDNGVLPVGAAGNAATDLGAPGVDASSPNFPVDEEGNPVGARERTIDNSTCLSVPAESAGVVTVTSTGPSGRKAYYSNYGTEQADVAAPGGDAYDTPNGRVDVTAQILSTYPENVLAAEGAIDENGEPTTPSVVREVAEDGTSAYYRYLQGTSMAAPHAAGVAALIVSEYGENDPAHPGTLTLDPSLTEALLLGTAEDVACPVPAEFTYRRVTAAGETVTTATCAGPADVNGFYGQGVVNAVDAVTAF